MTNETDSLIVTGKELNYVASRGERRVKYIVSMGKTEGKTTLGKQWRRWKTVSQWIFKKYVEGVDWIDLAQDRETWGWAVVNAVMKLLFPYNTKN